MAISGSLQDVSANDVMQFVHLGQRTGTLLLNRREERAVLGFHLGKLVSAQVPGTPKLGDLLAASGKISREALQRAVELQARERGRRSLGQILTASSGLTAEDLRTVVATQLEQAVAEVVTWNEGTFDFALDDLRPIDDIALLPGDAPGEAYLETQMVLLEAARIFDERDRLEFDEDDVHLETGMREGAPAAAGEDALAPPAEESQAKLLFVSPDLPLAVTLAGTLRPDLAEIIQVDPTAALGPASAVGPAIVLVDLRAGSASLVDLAELRAAHPSAALLAVVDRTMPLGDVYAAGAIAALPGDPEVVAAYIGNLRRAARGAPNAARAEADSNAGVARLRRVFGELRSGLISATVALNLMHLISESFERAVLFLVKRDELSVLGAFGTDAKGRPLAEAMRGLRLRLDGDNALTRGWRAETAQSIPFEEADLPEPFRTVIGPPRNGQVVVFPVLGAQRVISIVYADNGERSESVENLDILEVATSQVGIAFENELLRRQMANRD